LTLVWQESGQIILVTIGRVRAYTVFMEVFTMPDLLDSLEFRGNSHAMLQTVMQGTPVFFRSVLRDKINGWIRVNNVTVVTEETVFKAVHDLAPPGLARSRIIPALEEMRS
jgi:hypothetical protein